MKLTHSLTLLAISIYFSNNYPVKGHVFVNKEGVGINYDTRQERQWVNNTIVAGVGVVTGTIGLTRGCRGAGQLVEAAVMRSRTLGAKGLGNFVGGSILSASGYGVLQKADQITPQIPENK